MIATLKQSTDFCAYASCYSCWKTEQ